MSNGPCLREASIVTAPLPGKPTRRSRLRPRAAAEAEPPLPGGPAQVARLLFSVSRTPTLSVNSSCAAQRNAEPRGILRSSSCLLLSRWRRASPDGLSRHSGPCGSRRGSPEPRRFRARSTRSTIVPANLYPRSQRTSEPAAVWSESGRELAATLRARRAHSSSGLGHRPLTAAARVRIPYAPLACYKSSGSGSQQALAQDGGLAVPCDRVARVVGHDVEAGTTGHRVGTSAPDIDVVVPPATVNSVAPDPDGLCGDRVVAVAAVERGLPYPGEA